MSRTLIICFGRYPDGGAGAKRVRQMALGLKAAGDNACVLGYCRGQSQSREALLWLKDEVGVEYTCTSVVRGWICNPRVVFDSITLSSRMARMASAAVQERKFSRVLLYGFTWAGLGRVVARLRRENVPMVADMNEWFLWSNGPRGVVLDQKLFRRICIPRLQGIVGISPFWAEYAHRQGKPVLVVPAMADNEFDAVSTEAKQGVFNLVYVGVLFRRDLPQTMLEGVRLAAESGCNFRFIVLGQPGRFPESQAARRKLESDPVLRRCTEVTGWVTRERLQEIYRDAGAFLLLRADDWETRASSATRLPEFLSTGRPVITSKTAEAEEYLKQGRNAWLLPTGHEPEELAEAICNLARHSEEATRIGAAGQDAARTHLDFRNHGRRLFEFLEAIESGTTPNPACGGRAEKMPVAS